MVSCELYWHVGRITSSRRRYFLFNDRYFFRSSGDSEGKGITQLHQKDTGKVESYLAHEKVARAVVLKHSCRCFRLPSRNAVVVGGSRLRDKQLPRQGTSVFFLFLLQTVRRQTKKSQRRERKANITFCSAHEGHADGILLAFLRSLMRSQKSQISFDDVTCVERIERVTYRFRRIKEGKVTREERNG